MSRTGLPLVLTLFCATVTAQDWPAWRGPMGDGRAAADARPPLAWSETENVRWKVPIPGLGSSTPCVLGDRIYVTTAVGTGEVVELPPTAVPEDHNKAGAMIPVEVQDLLVLALDRHTGEVAWQTRVGGGTPPEKGHETANFASASPIVDGERLYAFFGSLGLYCLDLNGEVLWSKDLGDQNTMGYGEGASPALGDGVLVVPWDNMENSFLVGLAAATGEQLWRRERQVDVAWGTPLIATVGDRQQVIVHASKATDAYDLATGEPIWTCGVPTENPVVGPTVADGVAYVSNSYKGRVVQAIGLAGAEGDITETENVLWEYGQAAAYVPMPLVADGLIYFLRDSAGVLYCLDARTGEPVYEAQRLRLRHVHASPVLAAGRIYIAGRDGTTVVVKAGRAFEVLATNQLDDTLDAIPVIVGECLYLRGHAALYCIAQSS